MLLKSKFFRLSFALTLALSLSLSVFADTIRLKDGSIIKGKITNFGGGRFTVVINDGTRQRQLIYNVSDVESISFDGAAADSSPVRTINENAQNPVNSSTVQDYERQTSQPAEPQPNRSTNNANSTNSSKGASLPITINVKVLADNTSNGWTNSGFVVQKGQRIRITSSGRITLGSGRYTTPEGISSLPDTDKLMQNQATGALIAVVGDDNNDFLFIGGSREFTATRDGALFLGVNEGNLDDNSGVFDVKVEIYPNR